MHDKLQKNHCNGCIKNYDRGYRGSGFADYIYACIQWKKRKIIKIFFLCFLSSSFNYIGYNSLFFKLIVRDKKYKFNKQEFDSMFGIDENANTIMNFKEQENLIKEIH